MKIHEVLWRRIEISQDLAGSQGSDHGNITVFRASKSKTFMLASLSIASELNTLANRRSLGSARSHADDPRGREMRVCAAKPGG